MNYMSVERCVFLVCPEQSPAAKQISAFLPESCFTRFMCTGDSAEYGVAKLSLSGHCHKCASLVIRACKILPGIIRNHHAETQLVITITYNRQH